MGNYVARNCRCECMASWPPADDKQKKQLKKTIKVVHPAEQRVLELGDGASMTVAEVMLELCGHFMLEYLPVSPLQSKSAIALPADQEAFLGRVYVLLPIHRLHARISPHKSTLCESLLSSSCLLHRHRHLPVAACNQPKKKSLHSLVQASSAKVAPLSASSQHVQEKAKYQLAASHPQQDVDAGRHSDVENDLFAAAILLCKA